MSKISVDLDKVINAPIEVVFDAWLDPKTMASFMMPMEGMVEPLVEIDASVGGQFSIIMKLEGKRLLHSGKYLEIERYTRLVFTWDSPSSPKESIVTLEFTKIDEQKTNIRLTHVKFTDEENRKDHEGGWSGILNALTDLYI